MSIATIKKGDRAWVMSKVGIRRTELVTSVGPVWITTAGEPRSHRWRRSDGKREDDGIEWIQPAETDEKSVSPKENER